MQNLIVKHSIIAQADNLLESFFAFVYSRYYLFTTFCFFIMLGIMIICAPFDRVLEKDAYGYILKAFEITHGNWTPNHHYSIGWPIFIAFFIKLFGIESYTSAMLLSRILSIALMGLSVFVFAGLARKLVDAVPAIIAVLAFIFYPMLISHSFIGYSESLFVFLVLSMLYFWVDSDKDPRNLLAAVILASLAYYVRPNGVVAMISIALYGLILVKEKKANWVYLLLIPVIFFAVSLLHLYLRYAAYGSPFDYGANTNWFVENYDQAWNGTAGPTLWEYLNSHNIVDYYRKFIRDGLFKIAYHLYNVLGEMWFLLLLLGTVSYVFLNKREKFFPLFIFLFISLGSMIPAYQIHNSPRYFVYLIPVILIISSKIMVDLLQKHNQANLLILPFILLLPVQIPVALDTGELHIGSPVFILKKPQVRDEWVKWAVDNLSGDIAMVEGLSLMEIYWRDTHGSQPAAAPKTPFDTMRPENYSDLGEAIKDFKEMNIRYLLLEPRNLERRPYLKQVYDPKWSTSFVLVKSFRSKPEDRWMIQDMDIFKIVY